MHTIFALATAQGKAGVAVIRISGPLAFAAASVLAGSMPEPRKTGIRRLSDRAGALIDEAMVICFAGPASFTGEDVVELHLHGSPAIVRSVMNELSVIDGLRLAEPGEFTRRALENERLDLAQVEGLSDLIEAETEAQRQQAMKVFSGGLSEQAELWRSQIIRAAALLEATIDFADEEVPEDVTPEVQTLLRSVKEDLQQEIVGSEVAERLHLGFEVAIVGAPNAGKSTLLNYIAKRDAAITSDIAGTTRDVIEVRMDLKGLPVTFLDTAGLRETDDQIEGIGIERAMQRAKAADLRIFLNQSGEPLLLTPGSGDLQYSAKGDTRYDAPNPISGVTGLGVIDMLDSVHAILSDRLQQANLASKERHRVTLLIAKDAIAFAEEQVQHGAERYELVAEEIRTAARALDSLLGRIDVEVILDEIFSSFCLGK
ncbi:tRNA uridine-5-carboxymethylaminomethyl(34) synthesis GTPase MnmE [Donghicola eburneus]|uniref:tRNA modification GTPase MnmE n=1 Tax=Donghicola eburneus TaxID=393278 RepID=A0A1M4N3H9_9RHOB|nr:tRNA uridine-5-carboxymethylaminomethyl(34) synthesis GTPase MnmE [Donghicola eburneus]SCM69391.1 tRNA modification GTPase MnmE [Donghicola eburneus]SFQ46236.1 tRNA modification GTPase trmE [Donghicola eburneus]